ncbi:hypothetical protein PG985_015950 [Apiospora marii]|uniref:uncharacterized protein n=1 Tax=Apiospora marii TaxID=335849 RepID=UPI0031325809
MPSSSLRDPSPPSSSTGKKGGRKQKQRLTQAAADAGSKKKDKNVKDGGGVVAAVTRQATKFSNGSTPKEPASLPESPPSPAQTPELKPAAPETIPANRNPTVAVSPLLDAVSGTSIATSTAPSMSEWARSHGALAGSPNLISIMGESPPTQPSSYEDPRAQQWMQQKAFANNNFTPSSASPPNAARRPLSFQLDNQLPANDLRSQTSSPPGGRRSSMHSPYPQSRVGSHPPLPHQPQAHFYGVPDLDFDLNPKLGLKPGDRGYYFGFDTLSSPNVNHTSGSTNVVLAGYEGGLDIYAVSKRGIDILTSLKGLRGGVYQAKILPWHGTGDQHNIFPLIAVAIHGPVVSNTVSDASSEAPYEAGASPRMDGASPVPSDTNQRQANTGKTVPTIEAYQTTVEIYSLRTNARISTLLQAPRIPVKTSVQNPIPKRPSPTGALQIHADGGNIIVASGTTGECWIFKQAKGPSDMGVEFRCVGKVWTCLQHAQKDDSTPEEEAGRSPSPLRSNPQSPILATRGRWLAYCPPPSSSSIALNASIGVPIDGKVPGLASLTSPVVPLETCGVDQPLSDGMMNRIMRETTQEVIQGARWVGKQGMQLWNSYWKQPSPQSQTRSGSVGSPPWGPTYPSRADTSVFPPTYGVSGQAVTKDPGLVSIVDLQALEHSTTVHHVATFKAPLGCSFLSFSPTGLSLFTASIKGDVQTVWDLMRIQHSKASSLQTSQPVGGHAARVRQVAQFSRMTVARIVDVAWSKPNGERIAMVTERGTVHLLDMPPSAYTWPPPRRRAKEPEQGTGTPETAPSAVSMASNALSSAYGAARPLIARQRRSSSNTQNTSRLMDHASYGGKVLAAGISHSLGNAGTAINHLRQNGENRVSLPTSGQIPSLSCVTWIAGRKHPSLVVIGDGLVRLFATKGRKSASSRDKPRFPRGNMYKDFRLKGLSDDVIAPTIRQLLSDLEEDLEITPGDFEGGNTLVLKPRSRPHELELSPEASIPQAEIESSAPYQPFHTDRRVALFEYSVTDSDPTVAAITQLMDSTSLEEAQAPNRGKSSKKKQKAQSTKAAKATGKSEAWAFGQSIAAVKIETGPPISVEDDFSESTADHRALPASAMERVMQVGENDEQIVVTTRRRRGGNRVSDAEEDGFFEDDCEVLDFADQRV